jgi:hypothetical protein
MMANTPVPAAVNLHRKFNPILKHPVPEISLEPLAGCTDQDGTVYTGPWVQIGAGANLVLELNVASTTGGLDVLVETLGDPESKTEKPRPMGQFETIGAAGSLRHSFPCSDTFVRVVAKPMQSTSGNASWTVRGKALLPVLSF